MTDLGIGDGQRMTTEAFEPILPGCRYGDVVYPSLNITVSVLEDGRYAGRERVEVYPPEMDYIEETLLDEPGHHLGFGQGAQNDHRGYRALSHGGRYYDEAMNLVDPSNHQRRIDCFRAAELLYLHSAARGNEHAYLCLGYVCSYHRCGGDCISRVHFRVRYRTTIWTPRILPHATRTRSYLPRKRTSAHSHAADSPPKQVLPKHATNWVIYSNGAEVAKWTTAPPSTGTAAHTSSAMRYPRMSYGEVPHCVWASPARMT